MPLYMMALATDGGGDCGVTQHAGFSQQRSVPLRRRCRGVGDNVEEPTTLRAALEERKNDGRCDAFKARWEMRVYMRPSPTVVTG